MRLSSRSMVPLLALLASVAWRSIDQITADPTDCGSRTDMTMASLFGYAKNLASNPGLQRQRSDLKVPHTSDVEIVSDALLCKKAGQAINRWQEIPDSTKRIVSLVRIGSVYLAQDPAFRAGEYVQAFVVDSSLHLVLSKVLR